MSSINGIGGNSPLQKLINDPIYRSLPTPDSAAAQSSSLSDRLELTGASHLLPTLQNNDVRTDKVQEIRAQLEAGTFDENGKLDASLDKLMSDLAD